MFFCFCQVICSKKSAINFQILSKISIRFFFVFFFIIYFELFLTEIWMNLFHYSLVLSIFCICFFFLFFVVWNIIQILGLPELFITLFEVACWNSNAYVETMCVSNDTCHNMSTFLTLTLFSWKCLLLLFAIVIESELCDRCFLKIVGIGLRFHKAFLMMKV